MSELHGEPAPVRAFVLGAAVVCLLLSACRSSPQPPAAAADSTELCIVGRQVLPLDTEACRQQQQHERQKQHNSKSNV